MELVKNIFFNTDKIVENTEVKITYAGYLFQNESNEVIIHYGFGDNWSDAQDVVMEKTDLGYQANINVLQGKTLNFCFRNSNGEWDNNCGCNYQFEIEEKDANEENVNVEQECVDAPLAVYKTSSWGELFKKTFSNFVNYFTKLFSKGKEQVNNSNND